MLSTQRGTGMDGENALPNLQFCNGRTEVFVLRLTYHWFKNGTSPPRPIISCSKFGDSCLPKLWNFCMPEDNVVHFILPTTSKTPEADDDTVFIICLSIRFV